MKITNQTTLNLVIGNPLTHTQSPFLHQCLYPYFQLDAILLARPHTDLDALINAIRTLSVKLTAVTMPYKEAILPYLDDYSAEVQALGACNTIIQQNAHLYGHNTDVDGIVFALNQIPLYRKRALILGAGGAAKAVGHVLHAREASLFWFNRTPARAAKLADQFGGEVMSKGHLNQLDVDIIINTTPIGLYPYHKASPLPHYPFREHQTVFDMVYHPAMTQLLKDAKKANAQLASGLDMFIGQAIKQLELMTETSLDCTPILPQLRKKLCHQQRMRRL